MKLQPPKEVDSRYAIFALIFMLSNRLQTIGDSFFEDISTKQWFVITILRMMNGYTPTLNELSEAVGSSHQNVKQLVLKLEKKGYLVLSKDEEDARRLRIKATDKCEEFSHAYEEKSQIFIERLFGSFKESDLATTMGIMISMKDILENLEKDYVHEK